MEIDIAEIRNTFFQDAEEHLEEIDDALAQLSPESDWSEPVSALFRCVHSLKGDSGALGYAPIETLLHRFETQLDLLRGGEATLTAYTVDVFSVIADCIEQLIDAAKEDKPTPQGVDAAISLLEEMQKDVAVTGKKETPAASPKDPEPQDFGLFEDEDTPSKVEAPQAPPSGKRLHGGGKHPFFGDFLIERGKLTDAQVIAVLDDQRSHQPLLGSLLIKSGKLSMRDATAVLLYQQEIGGRFGETAVQMGALEESALFEALTEQRRLRPSFRQSIVHLGFLDKETVTQEFDAFVAEYPEAHRDGHTDGSEQEDTGPSLEADGATEIEFTCDQDLLAEFISDSDEHLSNAEEQLLVIESEPNNSEALHAIYRAFHTVKGLSSFLGLEDTRNLAHQAESMFNLARDGHLTLTGDSFEVALASVDGLKRQVRLAEQWLHNPGKLHVDEHLPTLLSAIDAVINGTTPTSIVQNVERSTKSEPDTTNNGGGTGGAAAPRPTQSTQVKETIKVDRDRLDKLINVIGELVISNAMVEQEFADQNAEAGNDSFALSQLDKTVRDLQELSLSLRMVPVGSVFHKMARIVRDLGRKLGKDIKFKTEGDETELDKTVVDQIGDPLLHMVRNAADHGIETPEERIAAGKPPQGNVTLRAYHQGGNIFLEITDDGKGLDRDVLLKKAIEKGIVSENDSLSEAEIFNLILAPGFSTAKQVTDVSGRGVGMDVVRRNVEALQGSVSINSRKGEGSTVVIRLPLTLAILDGLSIRVGAEMFIVPILSVIESFSPAAKDLKRIAGKGEVVMVRGEVLPLLRLDQLLGVTRNTQADSDSQLLVIVEDRGKKYALLVDDLLGQSQVVIKNLEANYQKVDGLAGATILGDGRVAMILDVFGLVCLASNPPGNQRAGEATAAGDPFPAKDSQLVNEQEALEA